MMISDSSCKAGSQKYVLTLELQVSLECSIAMQHRDVSNQGYRLML